MEVIAVMESNLNTLVGIVTKQFLLLDIDVHKSCSQNRVISD